MKKTCPGGTRKCNSQLSAVDNDGKHMMSINNNNNPKSKTKDVNQKTLNHDASKVIK